MECWKRGSSNDPEAGLTECDSDKRDIGLRLSQANASGAVAGMPVRPGPRPAPAVAPARPPVPPRIGVAMIDPDSFYLRTECWWKRAKRAY